MKANADAGSLGIGEENQRSLGMTTTEQKPSPKMTSIGLAIERVRTVRDKAILLGDDFVTNATQEILNSLTVAEEEFAAKDAEIERLRRRLHQAAQNAIPCPPDLEEHRKADYHQPHENCPVAARRMQRDQAEIGRLRGENEKLRGKA